MIISLIAAIGKNLELGLDGKLLWNIPADMKNFVKLTKGKPILVGRKTFESFKGPLPNRLNIILTTNTDYKYTHENVLVFYDIEKALAYLNSKEYEEVVVCGGAEIYKYFLNRADQLYMSFVDWEGKADTFFPEFDFSSVKLCETENFEATEKSPSWTYKLFKKVK